MNIKIPLGILLVMAAVLSCSLRTEVGWQQREGLLRRIRREETIDEGIEAAATEAASTEDRSFTATLLEFGE